MDPGLGKADMAIEVGQEMVALLPRLRRFARGLCKSADQADDLVQGACERAWRAIDSWKPGTRFDSWMYRIVRNLWIDQTRRERMDSLDDDPIEVAGEDGRRTVEVRLELQDVRAHISTLPADQREVLVLVCIEDMSYREAAEILQVPIGTVMSRLARARTALSTSLNNSAMQIRARGAAQ
jgi:RNA polymerase sigma-70 factor (ECF subfamily)